MARAKAKRTKSRSTPRSSGRTARAGTSPRTGRIRARREQSERRVINSEQVAKVHQQINDALAQGRRLRKEIEARIDRVLREHARRSRPAHR